MPVAAWQNPEMLAVAVQVVCRGAGLAVFRVVCQVVGEADSPVVCQVTVERHRRVFPPLLTVTAELYLLGFLPPQVVVSPVVCQVAVERHLLLHLRLLPLGEQAHPCYLCSLAGRGPVAYPAILDPIRRLQAGTLGYHRRNDVVALGRFSLLNLPRKDSGTELLPSVPFLFSSMLHSFGCFPTQ
jgi:hypothetical protein